MEQLSGKELEILRFIRTQRHKSTVKEIARGLNLDPGEVDVSVRGLQSKELLRVVAGSVPSEDGYYTNPEKREEIYNLIG